MCMGKSKEGERRNVVAEGEKGPLMSAFLYVVVGCRKEESDDGVQWTVPTRVKKPKESKDTSKGK